MCCLADGTYVGVVCVGCFYAFELWADGEGFHISILNVWRSGVRGWVWVKGIDGFQVFGCVVRE